MSISYGSGFIALSKRWADFKGILTSKHLVLQYEEDDNAYYIFATDLSIIYETTLFKGELLETLQEEYSQAQNDADRLDFENNYKDFSNKAISAGTPSIANSTSTPLTSNAEFEGGIDDVSSTVSIDVSISTDQNSAADGLIFEWSQDKVTWGFSESFTIQAGVSKAYSLAPRAQYFRVRYTNGITTQNSFKISTSYYPFNRSTYYQNLSTDVPIDRATDVVRAVIAGKKAGAKNSGFTNLQATDSGLLKVSVDTAITPAPNTTSVVQEKSIGPSSGQQNTVVLNNNTGAGNTLIVVVIKDSSLFNVGYTLSDSQSNAYTKDASTQVSSVRQIDIWHTNSIGGPCTVQANFNTTGISVVQVYEISGLLVFGDLIDKIATAQNTGTSHTVGPTTTTFDNEFCMVVYGTTVGSESLLPGAGWTSDFSSDEFGAVFSQIQSVAGELTSAATSNSSITTIGVIMTFTPASVSKPIAVDSDGRILVVIDSSTLPTGSATETTLATRASEATLSTLLTESTFISRINTLGQKTMAGSIPVVLASDQSEISVKGITLPPDKSLPLIINMNFEKSDGAIAVKAYKRAMTYTIPTGFTGYLIRYSSFQMEEAKSRLVSIIEMGTLNTGTNVYAAGLAYTYPQWSGVVEAEVTTTIGSSQDITITITYTNEKNVSGRTGTVFIPKTSAVGSRFKVSLQSGDIGIVSVQNLSAAPNTSGAVKFLGNVQIVYHNNLSDTIQLETIYPQGAVSFPTGTVLGVEYAGSTSSKDRFFDLIIQLVEEEA